MRRLLTACVACACVMGLLGVAADAQRAGGAGGDVDRVARMLKKMDKDGDGKISMQEWAGSPQRFQTMDENDDELLSEEELRAAHRPIAGAGQGPDAKGPRKGPQGPGARGPHGEGPGADPHAGAQGRGPAGGRGGQRPNPAFALFDSNRDGFITKKEVNAVFAKGDADKDGRLSAEEVSGLADAKMTERLKQMYKSMDKDGDGKVSLESEVPERMRPRLTESDANKDGFLTFEEVQEAFKRQRGQRPRGGQGGQQGSRERGQGRGQQGRGERKRPSPEEAIKRMDKDGNGKLTKDEFRGPDEAFDRIDADSDGSVTVEELKAAHAARGERERRPETAD